MSSASLISMNVTPAARASAIALLLLCSSTLAAAKTASDSILVSATNAGSRQFDIIAATYTFGAVNPLGAANSGGTQSLTGTIGGGGATYTATTATTWRCSSTPPATARFYNASTSAVINWGNANRLSMQIPTTNLSAGSVSCGYKTFTTTGDGGAAACTSGNLIRNVTVKNGGNASVGNIDFQLFVANTDATGTNTWIVVITAAGL